MENILSQIPQVYIEKYAIEINEYGAICLYTEPKTAMGFFAFANTDVVVQESEGFINLTIPSKFILTLWKNIQHTSIILF